jgi:hypothetical protein
MFIDKFSGIERAGNERFKRLARNTVNKRHTFFTNDNDNTIDLFVTVAERAGISVFYQTTGSLTPNVVSPTVIEGADHAVFDNIHLFDGYHIVVLRYADVLLSKEYERLSACLLTAFARLNPQNMATVAPVILTFEGGIPWGKPYYFNEILERLRPDQI